MVVLHILLDSEAKMLLSKGNDLVQTLRLDAGRAADKTKRSANAFRSGLRAVKRTGFVPLSLSIFLKQAVNSGSLSMRYRASCNRHHEGTLRKDRSDYGRAASSRFRRADP